MENVLNNPDVGDNRAKITTAFGPNHDLDIIKTNVGNMKGNANMEVWSRIPAANDRAAGDTQMSDNPVAGKHGDHVILGSDFYKQTPEDQAGFMIHEGAHYFNGAGDDLVGPKGSPAKFSDALKGGQGLAVHQEALHGDIKKLQAHTQYGCT